MAEIIENGGRGNSGGNMAFVVIINMFNLSEK